MSAFPASSFQIRRAIEADLVAINDIYNPYVHTSTTTYQDVPSTMEERGAWFAAHGDHHPVTVAEIDGEVVGWAALNAFRERSAYRFTTENSVYVRQDLQRRGIGSALLKDSIERARVCGFKTIIAAIDAEQGPSIQLHARFGFETVGVLKQVGFKFDRWLDVVYMQLMT